MNHSRKYSLMKSFSWRIFATLITILISFIITNEISSAIHIGIFEFISKILFYYVHERIWENKAFKTTKIAV
jgi:uncharacterized membrane protein